MHYINREKFLKAFNQLMGLRHMTKSEIAHRAAMNPSYLYSVTSKKSSQKRLSDKKVTQIGRGLGLNHNQIQRWLATMGDSQVKTKVATPKKQTIKKTFRSHPHKATSHIYHRHHKMFHREQSASSLRRHVSARNRPRVVYRRKSKWGLPMFIVTCGFIAIFWILVNGVIHIYHSHEVVDQEVTRVFQEKDGNGGYNPALLKEKTNQQTTKELVRHFQDRNSQAIKSIHYNKKTNIATIVFNPQTAKLLKNASKPLRHRRDRAKMRHAINKGIKLDDELTNEAIEISNQSHNGYFRFVFANAPKYQAPATGVLH